MIICGLDFETQCADAKTTRVTEVGAALYHYGGGEWIKRDGFSKFCWELDYPPQTEKIVELTGITDGILQRDGKPREIVFAELLEFMDQADLCMAHKIGFDKTVLESTCKAIGLDVPRKEWLCTLTNFPWPSKYTCHKLGHLGWEHGLNFPANTLHRAEQDVDLMFALVQCYNFDDVLAYARTPWIYLRADVVGPWVDGGKQNGIAKSLGFGWEQVKGDDEHRWPKTWVARTKANNLAKIQEAVRKSISPFRVAIIEGV